MKVFYLRGDKITDAGAYEIAEAIKVHQNISSFYLSKTIISYEKQY